jgi:6-phosphogluconolactonase
VKRRSFRAACGLAGVVLAATGIAAWQTPSAGRLVFIGTYTGPNTDSKGIYAFRFDDRTGALTPLGLKAETTSPSFLAAGGSGRVMYAVNEVGDFKGTKAGSITSFAVAAATGALTPLGVQSTVGGGPCHVQCDGSGRFAAVANYGGGNFAIFPVGPDGRLGASSTVVAGTGSGPDKARQEGPHAHQVVFDPTNKYMLAVDLGIDQILVYRFDQASGQITPNDPSSARLPPGSGPRHLAFHPDGRFIFAISELSSTITSFAWDGANGALRSIGAKSTLPAGYTGQNSTAEIAVHPNGRVLYGSNRGHDSIVVMSIAPDGTLTPVEHVPTRGKTPRNFAIDPSGRWLIAANQGSGTLAVFGIDQKTGRLLPVGPLASVGSPVCVLFWP